MLSVSPTEEVYTGEELKNAIKATILFLQNNKVTDIAGTSYDDKVNTVIHHTLNSMSANEIASKLKEF